MLKETTNMIQLSLTKADVLKLFGLTEGDGKISVTDINSDVMATGNDIMLTIEVCRDYKETL